jgi:hypothetical protein
MGVSWSYNTHKKTIIVLFFIVQYIIQSLIQPMSRMGVIAANL